MDSMHPPSLRLQHRIIRACERRLGVHCYRIRSRRLDQPAPTWAASPSTIEIRRATDAELWRATENPDSGISRAFLGPALERGDIAFAAFDDETIVAYGWWSAGGAPHDELRVSISSPYVYTYKGFTLPSHRGLRLNINVIAAANSELRSRGFTHMIGFVALYNRSKLKHDRESGFQTVGYAGYFRWGAQTWHFRSPSVRQVGFRFHS